MHRTFLGDTIKLHSGVTGPLTDDQILQGGGGGGGAAGGGGQTTRGENRENCVTVIVGSGGRVGVSMILWI